ncbi:MAG: metallophosphoesterase [Arachnia sp.]
MSNRTVETFEAAHDETPPPGWTVQGDAGWSFAAYEDIVARWGTAGRQTFTRGAGITATAQSAAGAFVSTLVSPPVSVAGLARVQVRFDGHYRCGGAANRAEVVAWFDDAAPSTVLAYRLAEGYDNAGLDRINEGVVVELDVPAGAEHLTVGWRYTGSGDDGFWAIDNVEVAPPLGPPVGDPQARIHVISDIQGSTGERNMVRLALPAAEQAAPDLLALNGDLVAEGTEAAWDQFVAAFTSAGYPGRVISSIGNHEYYGGEDADTLRARFIARTNEIQGTSYETVYKEVVVGGVPVVVLGSEDYDYAAQVGDGPFVTMSEEQWGWLEERFGHWLRQGTQVLVLCHQVLPRSVSGTYVDFTRNDFGDGLDRFRALLRAHPNVVMITSHTHWSLALHDWAVEHRPFPADATGIQIANTGALANTFGPVGDADEAEIEPAMATGIVIEAFDDRMRIAAVDYTAGRVLQRIDFPNRAMTR